MIKLTIKNMLREKVGFSYQVKDKIVNNVIKGREESTLSMDAVSTSIQRAVDSGIFNVEFVSEKRKQTPSQPQKRVKSSQPSKEVKDDKSE